MYHKCTIISFPHFTSFNSSDQYIPNNQQHKHKQNSSKLKKPNPGGITKMCLRSISGAHLSLKIQICATFVLQF